MRNLGEQWVEEIDEKKHMLKAVNYSDGCNGCIFLRYDPDEFYTCNRGGLSCPVDEGMIIKDLGILNEDGCLPCPFCGNYPKIIYPTEYMPVVSIVHPGGEHRILLEFFRNKQEAIDAWNRRT
jgi:hypothetical protein